MRKSVAILIVFILMFTLTACIGFRPYFGKRPCDQPGTTWVSEDHNVVFKYSTDFELNCFVMKDGRYVEFPVAMGPGTGITLFALEASPDAKSGMFGENGIHPECEYWEGDFWYSDHFTATVIRTTYFEVSQRITFYRQDDTGELGQDIPAP